MLKVQEIRELIKLVDQSSIDEFSYEYEGSKIKMKKHGAVKSVVEHVQPAATAPAQQPVPAVQEAPRPEPKVEAAAVQEVKQEEVQDTSNLHKIVSPMVGTFYASSSPEADAYVKAGSKVSKDSVVCIVEAMKLFNEIEAEVNGEIVEILVKDGQLVEYGQPLFLVKPE
ncbi:acetyl-CoA carboxylase biotin carboxyl carrier protein [Mesobacillus sp. AQ2]|jgi:acetyl-CoA carboxylase biotin carboxyl carrier protein|uniref:acetyl-CoA carboxylase biotin carboxyl carrier protein n=1 Tax=Bacillaceae TaxID=186817 RepID=UPI0011A2BC5D|nr:MULTISPECIES: acetyl-CoA carboxylase biotin carboxyl carrier protein [Bacillaceae]MCM3122351.1 acetyl-CoA carboxylase biotin carboxyl carrier protein [Mesobacillus sp. MER 33]MCM3232315.1 acetyl-CoA carboxylase biotin carboxyl carrier protein [Mesobacillus sp. MER 48]WHX39260.1 acetyl-CoA carboxylase biotin carboxyl carrier protein [Mesobacillus sp. AQ2]